MRLYEYLIGGKKTGQIEDLKDVIPDSKPFCDLKTGESFFVSLFKVDGGTHVYTDEIKITSIDKKPAYWVFGGFTKKGENHAYSVRMDNLNKPFYVDDQRTYYEVRGTFKMDAEPLFELVKKEIKNSKK